MRTPLCIALSAALFLSIALPVDAQQKTEKQHKRGADQGNSDRERDMVKQMQSHGMTLSKAIAAAESNTGGVAVAARAHHEEKSIMIDVDCVVGDKVVQAAVDAATGKVTQSNKNNERDRRDAGNRGDRNDKKSKGDKRNRGNTGGTETP